MILWRELFAEQRMLCVVFTLTEGSRGTRITMFSIPLGCKPSSPAHVAYEYDMPMATVPADPL